MRVELIPLKMPRVVKPCENLHEVIEEALHYNSVSLKEGDILVISSKIVSTCLNLFLEGDKAFRYALSQADRILDVFSNWMLTMKGDNILLNSGVDVSNAPPGKLSILPRDLNSIARSVHLRILMKNGIEVGVIICDSFVFPLRRGTVGICLGFHHVKPIIDYRGERDLYGKTMKITAINVVDTISNMAHILMGEGVEKIPIVVVRGLKHIVQKIHPEELADFRMPENECAFRKLYF